MHGGDVRHGDRHDAEDVDNDNADSRFLFRFRLFERKHTNVAFLQTMMKCKQSPVPAVQRELAQRVPLAVHVPGMSRIVEESQSRRGRCVVVVAVLFSLTMLPSASKSAKRKQELRTSTKTATSPGLRLLSLANRSHPWLHTG